MRIKNNKVILSYHFVNKLANVVSDKINREHKGKTLITLTRGGLFATSFIANFLNWKPTVISAGDSYSKDIFDTNLDFNNSIFVDDILDTGRATQSVLNKVHSSIMCFYLTNKPCKNRIFTPDNYFSPCTITNEYWVIYPWEFDNGVKCMP
jgi:hypoxanthine phosphoribosyltransferase